MLLGHVVIEPDPRVKLEREVPDPTRSSKTISPLRISPPGPSTVLENSIEPVPVKLETTPESISTGEVKINC